MAKILLIYGRDLYAERATRSVIESLGHEIRDFDNAKETVPGRPMNPAIVEHLFDGVDAAVVVLSPDEESYLRQSLRGKNPADWKASPRVRPNVLLEHGMAVGLLNSKVVEISFNFPFDQIPSDWLGLNPIRWENASQVAVEVSQRFQALGIQSTRTTSPGTIEYIPPEPSFEGSTPPYSFIQFPFRLGPVVSSIVPEEEGNAYKNAGFELDWQFEEHQVDWQEKGWRPYIHKHIGLREYVRFHFEESTIGYKTLVIRQQ